MNASVVQEVITNLNVDTMESVLNGRVFPIFSKGWRNKIKALFYITTFSAKREPGTPTIKEAKMFPSYNDKMRTKAGTCKISECTIQEARRPLKFFNSLFLLRTSSNTISCSAIPHVVDALNGKSVDWPLLFKENIAMELKNIKEALFKERTTRLKSMVGPPLTMLLIAEELLTVSQEVQAGILVPSILEEPCSVAKKRKYQPEQRVIDTIRGESSTQGASGQQSSAQQGAPIPQETLIQPSNNLPAIQVALVQTNSPQTHSCIAAEVLHELLEKFDNTSSYIKRTFQEWSDTAPKKLFETLKDQHIGTEEQIKACTTHNLEQTLAETRAENGKLQQKIISLQKQHSDELAEKDKREKEIQTRVREMSAHFDNQKLAIGTTIKKFQQVKLVMSNMKEEAQQNMTNIRSEIEQYNIQTQELSDCVKKTLLGDQQRALEIAKIEAFDQWLSKEASTKEHITTQQLFDRVVTRIGHMFKALHKELRQTRSERDELRKSSKNKANAIPCTGRSC